MVITTFWSRPWQGQSRVKYLRNSLATRFFPFWHATMRGVFPNSSRTSTPCIDHSWVSLNWNETTGENLLSWSYSAWICYEHLIADILCQIKIACTMRINVLPEVILYHFAHTIITKLQCQVTWISNQTTEQNWHQTKISRNRRFVTRSLPHPTWEFARIRHSGHGGT